MPSRAALWWLPLLLALSFRLLNAVCSRAYFQPDEYWQNLEVAHRWIYGYGYQTWEWRSTPGDGEKWGSSAAEDIAHLLRTGGHGGIRSPLSVVVTAAVYALLKALAWDSGNLLVRPPKSSYRSCLIHPVYLGFAPPAGPCTATRSGMHRRVRRPRRPPARDSPPRTFLRQRRSPSLPQPRGILGLGRRH